VHAAVQFFATFGKYVLAETATIQSYSAALKIRASNHSTRKPSSPEDSFFQWTSQAALGPSSKCL
jgi:hypothetical protein